MAKIAIINDSPEIVALMSQAITVGNHEFLKMIGTSAYVLGRLLSFKPDLIVLPLHRKAESANRPILDFYEDISGAKVLQWLRHESNLQEIPIVLFGFFTTEADIPETHKQSFRYDEFLTFPGGLQELNPVISGRLGPAKGSWEDVKRLQHLGDG